MFKKYLTADNSYAQLDGNVNTTQVQILLKNGQNVPTAANWIATLVQYGGDGYPSKFEKVYVSAIAGSLLTVTRAYDGSTAQTFNDGDYIFLNVTSEVIKDLQNEVARIATDAQFKSEKNQANGYAGLDSNGKLDPSQIPALKSHEFLTVTNAAARYALTTSQVQVGDEVLETSTGETYVLIAADPSQAGSWLFKSDTTPSWSAIGGKPTTIAGYGITDAYTKTEVDTALGNYYTKTAADARYSQLSHTHTFASITSKPTTLSGYGITDAVTTWTSQNITGQKNFQGGVYMQNDTTPVQAYGGYTYIMTYNSWTWQVGKDTNIRNSIGLPEYDNATLISDLNNEIKTGWNICNASAANNPEADYTYLFTKMINSSFGMQDLEVRSTQRAWRRYRANNSWGAWEITKEPRQSYTPTAVGDGWSGATLNIMYAEYKRMEGRLFWFAIRATITGKGTCSGAFYITQPSIGQWLTNQAIQGGIYPILWKDSRGFANAFNQVFAFTKHSQNALVQWTDVAVNDEILISGVCSY